MLKHGRGAIMSISSRAAFMGESTRISYAVAKAGIHVLMRHVAAGWGKEGIRDPRRRRVWSCREQPKQTCLANS
jgi:hypothetical protein